MKRLILLPGMLIIGSVTFAQRFFIDGFVDTNFASVTPNIGIGIGFKPLDIMAGVNFSINEDKYEYGKPYSDSKEIEKWNSLGFTPVSLQRRYPPKSLRYQFLYCSGYDWGE